MFYKICSRTWMLSFLSLVILGGCSKVPAAGNGQGDSARAIPAVSVPDRPSVAGAPALAEPASAVPPAATLAGVSDDGRHGKELPAEHFAGRWEVIDVAADASAAEDFTPERRLIGRSFTYTPELATWYSVDGEAEEADRCPDPTMAIVESAKNVRELALPFRTAWSKFRIAPGNVGPAHNVMCDTADGAGFQDGDGILFPVGRDRLIMNWYNHNILLLRRTGG